MRFDTPNGPIDAEISHVVVAGWTGRDRAAVNHHIQELADIGVAPPSQVPMYYRVSDGLLSQSPNLQVLGHDTSGEIEPLVILGDGKTYLGLASDHTDRALEISSVAASKQICGKPVARTLWPWDEVADHLDAIQLVTEIEEQGSWTRYQDGTLAAIRPLPDLIASAGLTQGSAMLCGTLPVLGGVRPAARYRMVMTDPVLGRSIELGYTTFALPIVE